MMQTTPPVSGGSTGPELATTGVLAGSLLPETRKILVVDDSQVILKVLSLKLKSAGYEVFTAADGSSAVSAARQHKPDLIILDINFPPDVAHGGGVAWDAFVIMQWMRRIEGLSDIPVIIITSGDPEKYRAQSLAAGAIAFFPKPIDHNQLITTIRDRIGGGSSNQPTVQATM